MRDFLDDIERLSQGKGTKRRIGSRAIGHRLTPDERQVVRKALKQGFIKGAGTRKNVVNIYEHICREYELKMIVVNEELNAEIWYKDSYTQRKFESLEDLESFAGDNKPDKTPFSGSRID